MVRVHAPTAGGGLVATLSHLKAALLYADELVYELTPWYRRESVISYRAKDFYESAEAGRLPYVNEITSLSEYKRLRKFFGSPEGPLLEVLPAESGAHDTLFVPDGYTPMLGEPRPKWILPLSESERADQGVGRRRRSSRGADVAELALAGRLLSELPAFPDADLADIVDVRERLHDSRAGFRAAMVAAGRDLADTSEQDFPAAVEAYRRERIDPAALAIREELEQLRAVPTLIRAVSDRWGVPTVASLAIATAMLDVQSAAAAGGSAAGVALAAREISARRQVRRAVRQQPFWYLDEVDRELKRRTRNSARSETVVVASGWMIDPPEGRQSSDDGAEKRGREPGATSRDPPHSSTSDWPA